MIKQFFIIIAIFTIATCAAEGRQPVPDHMKPHIMVVSVSSDGNYAITTDLYKHAILWNLKKHTYRIIASHTNVYSAYFIKHTHDFMYQSNKDNAVYIKNVNGKLVRKFNPGFASYGNTITSNLKYYFASNANLNVYRVNTANNDKLTILNQFCSLDHPHEKKPKGALDGCSSFWSAGQPMNFTLAANAANAANRDTLIGATSGGFFIWDVNTGQMRSIVSKNEGQTFATISPDGQYVVSGDDDGNIFKFSLQTGKLIKAIQRYRNFTHSIKFISDDKFFVFFHGNYPFATLYSLSSDKKLKRLPLLTNKQQENVKSQGGYYNDGKYPATYTYVRDQAIDTSSSAHVLVMAMSQKNGILVYHYDPATQTLKQVWAPVVQQKAWWHVW